MLILTYQRYQQENSELEQALKFKTQKPTFNNKSRINWMKIFDYVGAEFDDSDTINKAYYSYRQNLADKVWENFVKSCPIIFKFN